MSAATFSPVYSERVLSPSYHNWLRNYLPHLIRIQKAHLCMLVEMGIVSKDIAKNLHDRIDWICDVWQPPAEYPIQEGIEDLYFLIERELAENEGEESAGWLHTARSRNDMDTTAFRMALRESLLAFCESLFAACSRIEQRARTGASELTILYTHGQPANPSTTEHFLSSFLIELFEDIEALREAMNAVDRSTMGACAITGTGFHIDRRRVADLLGFSDIDLHTYRAIAGSHWIIAPAQALQRLTIDIGRFIADLMHKASVEVGLYTFEDSLVQISSIMPQKRNPVILEHIRIQAGQVAGICASVIGSFTNIPYQDVNENADAVISQFLDAIPLATSVLELLVTALESMHANTERAEEICRLYGVTTTELADSLVRIEGIGFRAAHRICAAFAQSNGDLGVLRNAWRSVMDKELGWEDQEIRKSLDPHFFIAQRTTPGGPAAEGMTPVYAMLSQTKHEIIQWLSTTRARLSGAEAALNEVWKQIG